MDKDDKSQDNGDAGNTIPTPPSGLDRVDPVIRDYIKSLVDANSKLNRQYQSVRGNWQKAEEERRDLERQVTSLTDLGERQKLTHAQEIGKYQDYDTIRAELENTKKLAAQAQAEKEMVSAFTNPSFQHLLPLYQANGLNLRGDDGALLSGEALTARLTDLAAKIPATQPQQQPQQQQQQPPPFGGFFNNQQGQQQGQQGQRPSGQGTGTATAKTIQEIRDALQKQTYGSPEYTQLWDEYEQAVIKGMDNHEIKNPIFD